MILPTPLPFCPTFRFLEQVSLTQTLVYCVVISVFLRSFSPHRRSRFGPPPSRTRLQRNPGGLPGPFLCRNACLLLPATRKTLNLMQTVKEMNSSQPGYFRVPWSTWNGIRRSLLLPSMRVNIPPHPTGVTHGTLPAPLGPTILSCLHETPSVLP